MKRYMILVGGILIAVVVLVYTHYTRQQMRVTMEQYQWILDTPKIDKTRTPLTNQYIEWRLKCNGDCR